MRTRFHSEPIIQATELLLQERTPRDVAVARPRAEEVEADANVREVAAPMIAPVSFAARPDSANASAVQRQVHGDDHRGRLGLQPLARSGGHAMARGCHLRFVGLVRLSCATSKAARSGRRDISRAASRPDSYEVEFSRGSRGNRAARWHDHDHARSGGLAGGRRRSSPRVDLESRQPRSRDRADLVCRSGVGARRGRCRPSGLLQDVRADGIRGRRRRAAGHAAICARPPTRQVWAAHLAVVEGESIGDLQFETDRARFLGRGRGIRTPISVIDGQPLSNTVGTVLDPIFSLRRRVRIAAGRHRARGVLDHGRTHRAPRCSTWPTSITTRPRSSAR